jgi:hypothetical protein
MSLYGNIPFLMAHGLVENKKNNNNEKNNNKKNDEKTAVTAVF